MVEKTEPRRYRPEGIDDEFADPDGGAPAPVLPRLGWRGTLRWIWRQLTSMRVALVLLMLLAVAAVPGSVLPQRSIDPAGVVAYIEDNPAAGRWLDRLGFFDVYASPWFSAIYLLLAVSLIGCILPRTLSHIRALRARPPRAPSRFERFPVHGRAVTDADPDEVVEAAVRHLRGRRWAPVFRVDTAAADGKRTVAAERGYLRESGNILFHLALVGLLVSVAGGQLLHYRGQVIVTEGRGFANAVVDYDTFERGTLFRDSSLTPFSLTLDAFHSSFSTEADSYAQSRSFTAQVSVREPGASTATKRTIRVNHPLVAGGAKIYLQGNGYAPQLTVRDARGAVAFSGRVPFLPQDSMYTSRGVIKVPDVSDGASQIGMIGYLLPTARVSGESVTSVFPQALNPVLVLEVYSGDLGLDAGVPQNVYQLDTAKLHRSVDSQGQPVRLLVEPGQTVDLPDGLGTVTFESLPRYVALDLRHDPSLGWVLGFAIAALAGLAASLFAPRRRVWVRAWAEDGTVGRTVVEFAGLARGDDAGLTGQVERLVSALPGVGPSSVMTRSPDRRRSGRTLERPHNARS